MLLELVKQFKRAIDPIQLARDCGLEPDPWQATFLQSQAKRVLLNCSRQSGKSTICAICALHVALYEAPATVILISPSQTQSQEIFKKLHDFWTHLPDAPKATQENMTRLSLSNGSRVISLPGGEKTVRGYSGANLVVVDEAARVEDVLIAAVRPMLATTNGRFIALSTPAGKRGFFFEQWHNGEGWERIAVTADQCPRISKEFLASERADLGPFQFDQEYFGIFHDSETSAFNSELIANAFTDDVRPLRDAA